MCWVWLALVHRHRSVGLIHGSLVLEEEPRHLHVPHATGALERRVAGLCACEQKVRRRKYLQTPPPAATQYKCLVHTSLSLKTSESLRKLMLHMQACVNTYSYILSHAYFVLAFYRNAGALFHEDEYIQGDTHTYVSTRAVACFFVWCQHAASSA